MKIITKIAVLFVFLTGLISQAQLFQQQFATNLTSFSNSNSSNATYINASPSNAQFTYLGSSGASSTISIASNKLTIARTGNGWGFARGTAFSGPPSSLMIQFDYSSTGASVAVTSAVVFAVGGGASNGSATTSLTNADAHTRLAFNCTATSGQFVVRDVAGSTDGVTTFTGTQTILFVINNSGTSLTYKAPDGTYESVANDKFDVWVGTSKQLDEKAATTAAQTLSYFKCISTGGNQTVNFGNMLMNPIPAVPSSSAATSITPTGFTANWATVSGVTGYRVDVATDAAFTSLVSGYNNLYVSGQATNTLAVTGLSSNTQYWYRVRAASQYSVGEFAGDNSSSQTLTTTSASGIDGVISANEYGTHTNGNNQQSSASGTWYMTWDATNLYIAATGGTTTEAGVLYLDKNPITPVNGGSNSDGNLTGQNYDGSNFANLQFRADMVVYFKSGYNEYRLADGSGGWGSAVTTSTSAVAGTTREIAIPWSALGGKPSSFNWFGYIAYSGGGAYASVPTENPGSGSGTTIGSSARWDRYYTVSNTTVGSGTMPFSRNSYTFTSSSDISGFGAISAYDFTMNSSGLYISRTGNLSGNWTIAGNLTMGNGTIYSGSGGSGYGQTNIAGNLNLLGGSFNMDQSDASMNVDGNVTIASGASLILSGVSGGDLSLNGNFSNSGTFTPNSRATTFNGIVAQSITGATTFSYLTLNNSLGLTLNNAITVSNDFTLTSGKVTLGANNLTASGPITSSASNYVVTNGAGQLKRTVGAGAVTFPVGNSAYNPIILDNTGGTSDVYGINVLDGSYATPYDNTKVVNRRWQVSEAVTGGSNLSVVAQYNTADTFGANFTAGTTPLIGFYNGTSWTTVGATSAGANPFTYTSTANSTPSDITTGTQYFGLGKDNGFKSEATKLVITAISPATPSATDAFNVTVQAQDAYNFPAPVVAGTAFSLTTNGNAGAIGGTTTGTVLAATNSITVTGVTLATAGTGVTLTATRTSGDTVTAGTSATFTVLGAPTQLAFVAVPSTGNVGVNLTSFTVEVRRADNSVDTNYTGTVTITKASGTGLLIGTTSVAAVAGVATFNAAQFDNASTFTLHADSSTFTQITSGNIVVNLVPVVLAGWDFNAIVTGSPPATYTASTFNSNLVSTSGASDITRGAGAVASGANSSFRTAGFQNDGISTANTDYFQTTLTTTTGYSLNLASINAIYNGTASFYASPGVTSQYAYSLDGTTYTLIGSPVTSTTTGSTLSVDLTGVTALQNVASGTTVYIRYYASGKTTTGGWGYYSASSGTNGLAFTGNIICTQPTAYSVTGGGNYCPGGAGVAVGLANSQSGISYQLKLGGVNTGSPIAGTGSAIAFDLQTALGTYTVEATNGNAPCNYSTTMTGNAVLSSSSTTSTDGGLNWSNGTPTAAKSVIFDGSTGTIAADFAACTLTLTNNATVSVTSGYNVTLTGAMTVDSGSTFTLNNNANLLQSGTTNTNSGNIIVNRNSSALKRLDYTLWSSPVTGQGLYAFSKFTLPNRFYVYDTSTDLYSNSLVGFNFNPANFQYPSPLVTPIGVDGVDDANVPFTNGIGYLIRVPYNHPTTPTVYNGTFTGVANNGDISSTVSTSLNGYNAVGNPYPSRLSVPAFIDGNANITGPLYFWRKTNTTATSTSYATLTKTAYVANGSTGGDTGTGFFESGDEANWVINIGQGFIVKATGSTINFSNSMRRSSNADQFFRNAQTTTSVNNGLYWLNLTDNTGVYSQMAVGYSSEGTVGFDRGIDGENINKEFYLTSLIGADEYSIQGRSDFDASDIVPLSYKAMTSGNYTISIDHTAGGFTNTSQAIYLKDNLTNTLNNLNTAGYTFTTDAGTFNNRFEIVYQTQLSNPTYTENTVVIYNQNNEFVINSGNSIMASVKVFDIRGRLIEEKTGINASQTTIKGGSTNQVLLVQITSEDGSVVTKKVIR